jgi:3-phenylpropionate/trans-cinnamate dioxygenase ferredoxin reductase subunit
MLGQRTPFRAVPFFWTSQYGVALAYVGHAPSWDAIETRGEASQGEVTVAYLSHGNVRAVATIGRDRLSLRAEEALERDDQKTLRKLVGL